jgi:hypothetical protein
MDGVARQIFSPLPPQRRWKMDQTGNANCCGVETINWSGVEVSLKHRIFSMLICRQNLLKTNGRRVAIRIQQPLAHRAHPCLPERKEFFRDGMSGRESGLSRN